MITISTADDHKTALDEFVRLSWMSSGRDRVEEPMALIEAYEAEVHRQLRRDVTDVYCWLLTWYPEWLGDYQVQVPHGPDLRIITSVSVFALRPEVAPDKLRREVLAALGALGCTIAGPELSVSYPHVRYPEAETLSAHRRLEGYSRVKEAIVRCHL